MKNPWGDSGPQQPKRYRLVAVHADGSTKSAGTVASADKARNACILLEPWEDKSKAVVSVRVADTETGRHKTVRCGQHG